jgi:hypothetical protein
MSVEPASWIFRSVNRFHPTTNIRKVRTHAAHTDVSEALTQEVVGICFTTRITTLWIGPKAAPVCTEQIITGIGWTYYLGMAVVASIGGINFRSVGNTPSAFREIRTGIWFVRVKRDRSKISHLDERNDDNRQPGKSEADREADDEVAEAHECGENFRLGLVGVGVRGTGTGVVDVTFDTVRACSTVVGNKQRRVRTAAAQTEPHQRKMKEEENIRKEDEGPRDGNEDRIGVGAGGGIDPRLHPLLLTDALHQTTEEGHEGYGDDAVDREEEVHVDKAT